MTNDPSRQSKPASGPDWDAIARFLAGESAADEAETVKAWLDEHPVDRELVEKLDGIVTLELPADLDIEAALGRVHARIEQAANAPRIKVQRGLRSPVPSHWSLVGGVALAIAAALVAYVFLGRASSSATPGATVAGKTYRTNIGQRDSVLLADGSRVIIGPDSRVTVAADYGTASRTVELQGDAFFDVRHDAGKPFTVRVGRAVVEDVGTTFTVESDGVEATMVSVLSGSVRLRATDSAATSGALLAAGDRGALHANGAVSAFPHAVVSDDAAWTQGRLVFHDAPLSRVAAEIHRWYGVNVRIADSSLLNRPISNSFNGEPVDQVLNVIGLTLDVRVERKGDSATVYARRGSATHR